MSVLLLRLAGPMQSWGVDSRFSRRETLRYPTKSGVLGLIAAAQGRRRTDPVEDLAGLRFGVRTDQAGQLMSDFHTAHNWETGDSMPLSSRFYLVDACFVAGIDGDRQFLDALDVAIRNPRYPLFLGRRSCPATGKISLGVVDDSLEDALRNAEWQASRWYRRKAPKTVYLHMHVDADEQDRADEVDVLRDVPESFDPRRRSHGWRNVRTDVVPLSNEYGHETEIDFFAALGGV